MHRLVYLIIRVIIIIGIIKQIINFFNKIPLRINYNDDDDDEFLFFIFIFTLLCQICYFGMIYSDNFIPFINQNTST